MALSNTQLDRLGDRLRAAQTEDAVQPDDRTAYHDFRSSLVEGLDSVMQQIADIAGQTPTSRLKTLNSTIAKLVRQPNTRLSQVQDIVGCRVVVPDRAAQDKAVEQIRERFPSHQLDDRREHDQNGYRAVHVIVRLDNGTSVEVQVRTAQENQWANLCEHLADTVDPRLKYGGGPPQLREPLMELSAALHHSDVLEAQIAHRMAELDQLMKRLRGTRSSTRFNELSPRLESRLADVGELIEQDREMIRRAETATTRLSDAAKQALESDQA